jgi:hypothetical protein
MAITTQLVGKLGGDSLKWTPISLPSRVLSGQPPVTLFSNTVTAGKVGLFKLDYTISASANNSTLTVGDTGAYGRAASFGLGSNGSFTTNILGVQARDVDTGSSGVVNLTWAGNASSSKATIVGTLYYLETDPIT